MSDIEAPLEDANEQAQTLGDAAENEPIDIEAPEADAAEQHTPLDRRAEPSRRGSAPHSPEADEADAAEQAIAVESDEDDYR